jgi:WD40 repeat protein
MAQLAFSLATAAEPLTCDIARSGGLIASACNDAKLRLWSTPQSRLVHTLALGEREIDLTSLSDDGRWVVTGTHTGSVTVWNTSTGEAHMRFRLSPYPWPAVFSRDSTLLAISPMGGAIRIFDIATRHKRFELAPPVGGANWLSFSRDGARIATVDQDCVVRIYDGRTGRFLARNEDFLMEPIAVDFTADGRHIIVGGADRVTAYIETSSGRVTRRMDRDAEPAGYLHVSEDGASFAVQFFKADNMLLPASVTVWDIESGRKAAEWKPPTVVLGTAWTDDGKLLASTATKDAVQIWRVL